MKHLVEIDATLTVEDAVEVREFVEGVKSPSFMGMKKSDGSNDYIVSLRFICDTLTEASEVSMAALSAVTEIVGAGAVNPPKMRPVPDGTMCFLGDIYAYPEVGSKITVENFAAQGFEDIYVLQRSATRYRVFVTHPTPGRGQKFFESLVAGGAELHGGDLNIRKTATLTD